jgi:hypothetical protein
MRPRSTAASPQVVARGGRRGAVAAIAALAVHAGSCSPSWTVSTHGGCDEANSSRHVEQAERDRARSAVSLLCPKWPRPTRQLRATR